MSKSNGKLPADQELIRKLNDGIDGLGHAVFGSEQFMQMMSAGLKVGGRFQREFDTRREDHLHLCGFATHADVVRLAEKVVRLEDVLKRIETKLDAVATDSPLDVGRDRPARTKRRPKRLAVEQVSAKKPGKKSTKKAGKKANKRASA